jgi:hypothetical protein
MSNFEKQEGRSSAWSLYSGTLFYNFANFCLLSQEHNKTKENIEPFRPLSIIWNFFHYIQRLNILQLSSTACETAIAYQCN